MAHDPGSGRRLQVAAALTARALDCHVFGIPLLLDAAEYVLSPVLPASACYGHDISVAVYPAGPEGSLVVYNCCPPLEFCVRHVSTSRSDFNAPLHFAVMQRQRWAAGTPIIPPFSSGSLDISYFNPQAAWIGLEQVDIGQLKRSLEYARREGKPLWLEATAYDLVVSSPARR